MGFLDTFNNENHQAVYDSSGNDLPESHKGSTAHELIGGAVAYEAMKAYNDHCKKMGKPNDHAQAMQIVAGLAGGLFDKLAETKGLDYLDKAKAKHEAEKQAKAALESGHGVEDDFKMTSFSAEA